MIHSLYYCVWLSGISRDFHFVVETDLCVAFNAIRSTVICSMRKSTLIVCSLLVSITLYGCAKPLPTGTNSVSSLGKSVDMLEGEVCLSVNSCPAPVLETSLGSNILTNYHASISISTQLESAEYKLSVVQDYWAIVITKGQGPNLVSITALGKTHQFILDVK